MGDDVTRIREAIEHLRAARDLLVSVGAPRAADAVRRAIASAGGAERHATGRASRISATESAR